MSNNSIYTKAPTYFYTYQIYNIRECKFYIGSRKCQIDPIKDLGIKYFSSSSDKDFIEDQKRNPQNYEYTILGIHRSRKDALEEERSLHNAYNVAKNHRFYNRAKLTSSGFAFDRTGKTQGPHSEEHKRKISEANIGKTHSEETKQKLSEARTGKTHSEDSKRKMSEIASTRLRRPHSEETKRKISNALTGKTQTPHSEETKRKISEAKIGKPRSEETKRKLREANIGKIRGPRSEEHKRKLSEAKIGKPLSEEHKRKLSEAKIGKRWIFNAELKITRRISANEPIPDGWALGRKFFK